MLELVFIKVTNIFIQTFPRLIFISVMNNIKLLYYDRTEISLWIDTNKTSRWKECDICHYWYFLIKWFKFQPYVCNRCHDLLICLWALAILLFQKLKIPIIVVLLLELAKVRRQNNNSKILIWLKKKEHYKYHEQLWCNKVIRSSNLIKYWRITN